MVGMMMEIGKMRMFGNTKMPSELLNHDIDSDRFLLFCILG